MERRILIVVDMQKDFVDGALGTKEAQAIVSHVVRKVKSFQGEVIYTLDTHDENYMEKQEGHYLPIPHCLKGTPGWQLIPELAALQKQAHSPLYMKETFGSFQLAQDLQKMNEKDPIAEIQLIGLCTDICVVSNALLIKAALPEVKITVDPSCCAGVTPQTHEAALTTMKSCQVVIL
jgi:nicotinamidase-related amidase